MGCFGGSGSKNDQEEDKRRKEANKKINAQIQRDKQIYRATHRLLLLGKYTQFSLPIHWKIGQFFSLDKQELAVNT